MVTCTAVSCSQPLTPRLLAVVLLVGCSSPEPINVSQPDPGAIGVGLTETLQIVEQTGDDQCGLTLCPHDSVDHHFTATVITGSSVSVAPVMNTSGPDGGTGITGYAALRVMGLSEGPSTIEITGDDIITRHFDVTVAALGSSSLVMRYTDKPASVASPFEVISTPPSYIDIQPSYFDSAGTPLAGGAVGTVSDSALSVVCSGGRCVIGDPTCTGKCDCASSSCSYDVSIGSELGTATFSVPGASAELESVGVDAIHDFTISVPDPINIGGVSTFELDPTDVNGHPIFGAGGSPSVTSADPSICRVTIARDQNDRSQVTLYAESSGSTLITVSWGPITKSYSVMQP